MRTRDTVSATLRRSDVEPEEEEGNLAPGEEIRDDRGREQPDPEELRGRAAEANADAAGVRPMMMGGPASGATVQKHSEKTSASSRETRGTSERWR